MKEYIKSQDELQELANLLLKLAKKTKQSVYRYRQGVYDFVYFDRGRRNVNHCGFASTYNVEDIHARVFSSIRGEELCPDNLKQFEEWRKRQETPYIFTHKGLPLPAEKHVEYYQPATNYDQWDDEFAAFTREYKNERITREFGVEQSITVNSAGGVVIESRPFFSVHYRQGYNPYLVSRSVGAYTRNNKDVNRLPGLIQYLPDPTPDQRISQSKTFCDAFSRLHDVSHKVHFKDLDDTGRGGDLTHNVVMLSGVPIHEIFGHQFEEPVHPLNVGQQSLFPVGKNVQNPNIVLRDNPLQMIDGLEVLGTYHYDSYGKPAHVTTHIDRSTVREHLGGEYTDQKNIKKFIGAETERFYGCSRQGEDGAFPMPRMSCTVLEGTEEQIEWQDKIVMVPFDGYVLDGNFFKVMSSECYIYDRKGNPKRIGPLEGSRAIYDALIGMHILPGKSHHIGTCSKPNVLDDQVDTDVMVSFLTNHQMWEHLTLRSM